MKSHKGFLVLDYNTELKLPEQLYGTIKKVGILNKEPILYGDANLLKQNDLYYIDSIKQVYRFVATETMYEQLEEQNPEPLLMSSNNKTVNKYRIFLFTSINYKPYDQFEEELTIPEEERGTIRNAGYLFNKIIYSGDPNLVENGQLFYHDNLPFINVVGIDNGVITLATKTKLSSHDDATTIYTSYRVYPPTPHDYSKDYLTFETPTGGTFTLTIDKDAYGVTLDITSISYSLDNGSTWITETRNPNAETVITTPPIAPGGKVLWKGIGTNYGAGGPGKGIRSIFSSDCEFIAYGNIHSLTFGDDFINNFTIYQNNYYGLFEDSFLTSAENLILPATTLAGSCYQRMFCNCTLLTTAPKLPATTLKDTCYKNMFSDCEQLNLIAMLAIDISTFGCLEDWVSGVAASGTFVKNSAATWDRPGKSGIPNGWTIVTADS